MEWTEPQVDQLKELWLKGLSASQIGEKLGKTRNAVIGKAHRLGLQGRPSPIRGSREKPRKRPRRHSGVDILSLTERTCRWPIGHPNEPGFHFCGGLTLVGSPYCESHAAMAYQRSSSRREKKIVE